MKRLIKRSVFNAMLVLAALSVLLMSRCTIEDPEAPNWDVLFTVPLISKTYTMEDLADEMDELVIDEDTKEVILNLEKKFNSDEIGDHLRINGVTKETTTDGGSVIDSVGVSGNVAIVDSCRIHEGNIAFVIENLSNNAFTFHLIIHDLKDPSGSPLTIDRAVEAGVGSKTHFELALDDYIFTPPIYNGQNYIRFEGSLVGGQGDVTIRIMMTELSIFSFSGILNDLEIAIDSTVSELGIPEEFKDFEIQSADLMLALEIGVLFPIEVDIRIEALETREGTIPSPILIKESIIPTDPAEIDTIVVGDVIEFINSHPTEVLASGTIIVGDGSTHATIGADHIFRGTAIFRAPLTLTIPAYETKMDVDTLEIDEETRETIRDNLVEANFNAEVESRLPLGANVAILFSDTVADTMIYEPGNSDLRFDLQLNAAPTTGDPGIVSGSEHSTIDIKLDKDDLSIFEENEEVYFGLLLEFYGDTTMVQLRPDDSIEIEAYISALLNTDSSE